MTWRVTHATEGCVDLSVQKATCTCSTIVRHGTGCRHVMRVLTTEQSLDSSILLNLFHPFWRIEQADWERTATHRTTSAMFASRREADHDAEPTRVPTGPKMFHEVMALSKTIAFAVMDKSDDMRQTVLDTLHELLEAAANPRQKRRRGRAQTSRIASADDRMAKKSRPATQSEGMSE